MQNEKKNKIKQKKKIQMIFKKVLSSQLKR